MKAKEHGYELPTAGDLIDELQRWPRETEITFGSTIAGYELIFYRFKQRGENLLQIELNEWPHADRVLMRDFDAERRGVRTTATESESGILGQTVLLDPRRS